MRAATRALPDGEALWQTLQAQVYAHRMSEAEPMPGSRDFLLTARAAGAEIYVVSHKTQFAKRDPQRVDMRRAAYAWLAQQGYFEDPAIGLDPGRVIFRGTRREKIRMIAHLDCAVFIDDLEEVLTDPAFPQTTRRLLYTPGSGARAPIGVERFRSWNDIRQALFA
ncbi:hypothetical protein MAIT1_04079 [Magnetofaba australis IT-1]|uniref:Uncharacterized protein n=1 Tax=Magnetofaba australis IT-1 TaxID=1434232 RepID=A0A1Y2K4C1_9PROT|nr:hypothetical protein MAIT1_04079 [Magnetofaba australis IT-1]